MRPGIIAEIFRRYERDAGIVGVAYGPKEVGGKAQDDTLSVSFFVNKKLPVKGAGRRLADGRRRLPKRIELNGSPVPTDVVVTAPSRAPSAGRPNPAKTQFRTGGRISNESLTGTFGCLVRRPGSQNVYALTNRHIALDAGASTFFPDAFTTGGVVGRTERSADLVTDDEFLGVIDKPGTYIDVDAALVTIPAPQLARFSSDTPTIGRPDAILTPSFVDFSAYTASLVGRQVSAYSWKTGRRSGRISHVYYALRRLPDHTDSVAAFVVQSTDGFVPGEPGDSGKVWMTVDGGRTLAVGLHSGVVFDPNVGTRFAIVTEMASLARYFDFELYAEPV